MKKKMNHDGQSVNESVNATISNKVASKKQFKGGIDCWSLKDFFSKVRQYLGKPCALNAVECPMDSPISDYFLTAEDAREYLPAARTFPLSDESLYTFTFYYEKGATLYFTPLNNPDKEPVVFVGWFQDDDNDFQHYDLDSFLHTASMELLEGDCAGKTFLCCDC